MQAFAIAAKESAALRLTILGSGPLVEPLKARAAELGLARRIEFHDAVPPQRIFEFLHAHDLLVHPSKSETFGMTVVEAVGSGMPVLVTRASNNYGPYQFPEKLIPLMISNAIEDQPLPIYGDGMQIRDWLYVEDHCRAIQSVIERGREGEIYNIGGSRALPNIEVVKTLLGAVGKPESLMRTVTDRPGHDRRYALSSEKLMREIGWKSQVAFEDGLRSTIDWYRNNPSWIAHVKSGEYQTYYDCNYAGR